MGLIRVVFGFFAASSVAFIYLLLLKGTVGVSSCPLSGLCCINTGDRMMIVHNPAVPPAVADVFQGLEAGNQPVAAFGSRSARVSASSDPVQWTTSGDQASERLLQEMLEDGPEKAHKSLLARLQKRGADKPADGSGEWLSSSVSSVSRKLTSVNVPTNLHQAQSPDQLTGDGRFVRLGNSQPELVQEKRMKAGDVSYRFTFNNDDPNQAGQDVELSNCFYTPDKMPFREGANLDLLAVTGGYNNLCLKSSDRVYSGSMSIKIESSEPVSATLLRLVPHHDERLYKSIYDSESFMLPESSDRTYWSLVSDGMKFEKEGYSPFTVAVEPHNDQMYFTVKVRAQYDSFNDATAGCDIPFTPESATTNRALCCDGNQDVKYIYTAPFTRGEWFNIGFETEFSRLSGEDPRPGQVKLWRDGKQVAQVSGWIGSNNRAEYGGGGYHAQFGIVGATGPMVAKFRLIDLAPGYRQPDDPGESVPITNLTGQCRSNESAAQQVPITEPGK